MSRASATHASKCSKYIYRRCAASKCPMLNSLGSGFEFYDEHCRVWRPSIMREPELVELSRIF
jgi:hypothetical protein